jgi:hypothetical protein
MIGSSNIKEYLATVQKPNETTSSTDGSISKAFVTQFTANAVYWTGAAAGRTVSDTLRQKVAAVVLFDYSNVTTPILSGWKITINNESYSALTDGEDIAGQNKFIQVACEQFT